MQRLSPNQTLTKPNRTLASFGILCSDELRVTSPCLHFGRHAKRMRCRVRSILNFMVGGKFEPRYDHILSYFISQPPVYVMSETRPRPVYNDNWP